jgi:hypothetical protein
VCFVGTAHIQLGFRDESFAILPGCDLFKRTRYEAPTERASYEAPIERTSDEASIERTRYETPSFTGGYRAASGDR